MSISEDGNIEAQVKEFKRFQRCQENTKHLFKWGDLITRKSLERRIGPENMSRNLEEKKEVMAQGVENFLLDGSWLSKRKPQFVRYWLAYGERYHQKERTGRYT